MRAMCDVVERYAADAVKEAVAKTEEKYNAELAQKDSQIADLMKQLLEAQQKNKD